VTMYECGDIVVCKIQEEKYYGLMCEVLCHDFVNHRLCVLSDSSLSNYWWMHTIAFTKIGVL